MVDWLKLGQDVFFEQGMLQLLLTTAKLKCSKTQVSLLTLTEPGPIGGGSDTPQTSSKPREKNDNQVEQQVRKEDDSSTLFNKEPTEQWY